METQTTLSFHGRTEEACTFYGHAIDARTIYLLRFRDCPDPDLRQLGLDEKIFHATLRVGTTEIMASDCGMHNPPAEPPFAGFALVLRVDTPRQAERYFKALGAGGRIEIPLSETFFAQRYGIVVDRFGISWKVMVGAGEPKAR